MKKFYFKLISLFLFSFLVITGCQKEIKEQPRSTQIESELKNSNDENKNQCRLTEFASNGEGETFHYNLKGLCDEWYIASYGAVLKQEYDATGQLKKSRWYDGDALIYTIHFFYKGVNVNKEIWYDGSSSDVIDEVYYTYNQRRQNTRMESFFGDYYTVNTFDPIGNVSAWKFYVGGNLFYSVQSTFGNKHQYKNPRRAIPGLNYGFPYINAAVFSSTFCISSEKLVAYDENGDAFVLYDFDVKKTTYQPASQNYPSAGTFFDLVTNDWLNQTFQYENCGGGSDNDYSKSQTGKPSTTSDASRINPMMLLKRNPAKSIKEQAMELRRQLKK